MPVALTSQNANVRTRTGVVVTTTHPTLGAVYWEYVSEASVGGPDYLSLSTSMSRALLLEPGWRSTSDLRRHGDHVQHVIRDQVERSTITDDEHGDWELIEFEDGLGNLYANSGQTEEEFLAWLKAAVWFDAPGPVRIEHLIDHGYFMEWEVHSQTMPAGIQPPHSGM